MRNGFYLPAGAIQVLGMSGKARSGKDYLAGHVAIGQFGFHPVALADHFKISAAAKGVLEGGIPFDVDVKQLWETDKDDAHRDAFQQEGTQRGRLVYGEDVWCRHAELWMYKLHVLYGYSHFVVTDVRFANEVEWVKALGGKVYRVIGRGGIQNGLQAHASETALDRYTGFDRFVDNSIENESYVLEDMCAYMQEDFS